MSKPVPLDAIEARKRQGRATETALAKAVIDLRTLGKPITVAGVAAQAQVSRRQVYYYPRILAEIKSLRDERPGPAPGRMAGTTEYRSLQAKYAAARSEINQLKQRVRAAEASFAQAVGTQPFESKPASGPSTAKADAEIVDLREENRELRRSLRDARDEINALKQLRKDLLKELGRQK